MNILKRKHDINNILFKINDQDFLSITKADNQSMRARLNERIGQEP